MSIYKSIYETWYNKILDYWKQARLDKENHDLFHDSYVEACTYCLEDIMSGYKETPTRVPSKDDE